MSNQQANEQNLVNIGIAKEDIAGLEFRHGTYSADGNKDVLVVKEYIHTKDNRRIPNVRCVFDYERPFWVTHKGQQVHKEKREWEDLVNVKEFKSTQANLPRAVAAALGRPGVSDMRQLKRSPYIYGIDIPTSSLLKADYVKRWPKYNDGFDAKVAVFDIETDVLNAPSPEVGSGDIICASLTFKDKAILVATKSYLQGLTNIEEKVQKAFVKYLGKYKEKRGINLEFVLAENEAHAMQLIFQRAHEWKPDIISIWNMLFDVPKAARVLEKYGFRTEDVLSDPAVPRQFRHFKFIEGPSHMETDSGKMKPLLGAERWHIVECTASFYFVDAMCLYKRIRVQDGNLSGGYSLDNVLDTELGIRKLDFEEVPETVSRFQWHVIMQRDFKIEYLIYNLFDCISVEELDEKTGDMARSFSALCGVSDYGRFKSNPRRIVDDLHFYVQEHKKVIGTFADNVVTEFDKYIIPKDAWIVTLQSYLLDEDGARPFDELPDIISNIRAMVADLDIEGTYPNEEDIWNISNETTLCEANRIAGISFDQQRMVGINLSGGTTNAIEICMVGLQMPSPEEYLQQFMTEKQVGLCEPEKDYIDAAA